MAEELEIKLTLEEAGLEQARDWLLAQPGASVGPEKMLMNRYYDTPDSALNRHHAALRVRRAGDKFIQTLKTKGEFVAGAHRRNELEWVLPDADLDTGLLADTVLSGQVDLSRLAVVFETNFTRRLVMLEQGNAVIEVAIDQGRILAGGESRALNEVEFELKSGDPSTLIGWARALAEEVPVFLNLVSKAEQGYFLAGLHRPEVPVRLDVPLSVNEFLYGLGLCWLQGIPYPLQKVDLSQISRLALARQAMSRFDTVVAAMSGGERIGPFTASGELGCLQVALAAV